MQTVTFSFVSVEKHDSWSREWKPAIGMNLQTAFSLVESNHLRSYRIYRFLTIFILFDMFQLLCGEDDMKEMGIPMGPRKKLMSYLRNQKQEMVNTV